MFYYSQAQFKSAESMVKLPYVCILCNGAVGVLELQCWQLTLDLRSTVTLH